MIKAGSSSYAYKLNILKNILVCKYERIYVFYKCRYTGLKSPGLIVSRFHVYQIQDQQLTYFKYLRILNIRGFKYLRVTIKIFEDLAQGIQVKLVKSSSFESIDVY